MFIVNVYEKAYKSTMNIAYSERKFPLYFSIIGNPQLCHTQKSAQIVAKESRMIVHLHWKQQTFWKTKVNMIWTVKSFAFDTTLKPLNILFFYTKSSSFIEKNMWLTYIFLNIFMFELHKWSVRV